MRQHILVVEDSELVTEAMRVLLEATGRRVTVAATLSAARECAAADPPTVVLLDLTLPDGNGLTLARELRDSKPAPAVVALTGRAMEEIERECIAAGCARVLIKPVPTRELLEVLDDL